jgi:5-amino-6-(5-phosphoribosylamino)uracil reductase
VDLTLPLFAEPAVRTILITCASADPGRISAARQSCDVIISGGAYVDLAGAVGSLHERGLTRIHSEGGPRLLADLMAADLLDELLLTVSPTIAGGSFAGDGEILRILKGTPTGLRTVQLHHLLEEDSTLFASYRFRPPAQGQ